MKNNIFIFIVPVFFLLLGCNRKQHYVGDVENPVFKPNTVFKSYEDLRSPKFEHLKRKYQLDTIFHGEQDELKRILLLRHWIKTVIKIEDHSEHYSGEGYAEGILDAALKGEGFHCGHFMVVQNAVMNAYGYVTRCLGAGPGVNGGPDGHHGINEIWLNRYHKWFMSDAKYDHHFEKNGIPLSALEIRDEYLKNKAVDIIMVKGPDRRPLEVDDVLGTSKERYAQTFTWVEWDMYNNIFTVWPDFQTMLIMYDDDYFEKHTWIWGGKPHWAYNTEFLKLVKDRNAIEWTPNTIMSKVQINNRNARIELTSDTPNLKEYQIKELPAGNWHAVADTLNLKLTRDQYELAFRAVNLANVTGPEHKIFIDSK
ncbi:MAG: hypothetical protein GXO83_06955 [Chlorobi bacterium]|nr:hypothetical protein [Chlorobiota bacterium]